MTASQRWRRLLPYLAAVASLLLLWQVAALFLPPFLLPGIPPTLGRLGKVLHDPAFLGGLQHSLLRLAIGYPVAVLIGALAGLLAGLARGFAAYLRSLVSILQSIPPITWVPFLVILFGFGDVPIIGIIIIASFFPMALAVMNATEGMTRTHLELAQVMGASRRQLLLKVYLPEALPAVIAGAQIAFGNAWRAVIGGEMVGGASAGLGWSISYAGETADMKGVLIGVLIIGACAAFLDNVVLELIKRRLLRWRYVGGPS